MPDADVSARISRILRDPHDFTTFHLRWERYAPTLSQALTRVYGDATEPLVDDLLDILLAAAASRSQELHDLDEARLLQPDWLQSPETLGYVADPARFAGSLSGVADHLAYLKQMGVTLLFLSRVLDAQTRADAVEVADPAAAPTLGDIADLTARMRPLGISLGLGLTVDRVSPGHPWVAAVRAGDRTARSHFHLHPTRALPDAYERTLAASGAQEATPFVFDGDVWVWQTPSGDWALNWSEPSLVKEFAETLCELANRGAELIQLDGQASMWRGLGTSGRHQPAVQDITTALRACLRIVAPATALAADPQDATDGTLTSYLGSGRRLGRSCDLATHTPLQVQAWSALATRTSRLAEVGLQRVMGKAATTSWATLMRTYDPIEWLVLDEDAAAVGFDGDAHRRFLSAFFTGEHAGSFARGLVGSTDPTSGQRSVAGTLASLAGLELALGYGDRFRILDAVARIKLLHTLMLGFGGVPLIAMGDELALLNDYSYQKNPRRVGDPRWVAAPMMDWALVSKVEHTELRPEQARFDPADINLMARSWINESIRKVIRARKTTPQLHASIESVVVPSPDHRLLMLARRHPLGAMMSVYNISEDYVRLPLDVVRDVVGLRPREVLTDNLWDLSPSSTTLERYQCLWLVEEPRD